MRGLARLAIAALVAAPITAGAQTIRWNDRADDIWTGDAPSVRVWIEGSRLVPFGGPVQVRFEVSEDAYVAVGRVAGDGRLTILFPQRRTQRPFVSGNRPHLVYGRRAGSSASFFATDVGMNGYVFAIASHRPIDLSRFENGDFERMSTYSRYSLATRNSAFRPDEYIERFAAAALWDSETAYDYDVDYYSTDGAYFASSSLLCNSFGHSSFSRLYYDWGDLFNASIYGNPYFGSCSNYFRGYMHCLGMSIYGGFGLCSPYALQGTRFVRGDPQVPVGRPADTTTVPNAGVIRGGLWAPDTVSGVGEDDPRMGPERPVDQENRAGDREWERLYSIPERVARSLRNARTEIGRKQALAGTTGPSERAFDRPAPGTIPTRTTPPRATEPAGRERAAAAPGRAADRSPPSRPTRTAGRPEREPTRTRGTPAREGPRVREAPPRPNSPPRQAEPRRESERPRQVDRPAARPAPQPAKPPVKPPERPASETRPPAQR